MSGCTAKRTGITFMVILQEVSLSIAFYFLSRSLNFLKAVCANAGWFTMPGFSIDFPNDLRKTTCTPGAFEKSVFQRCYGSLRRSRH